MKTREEALLALLAMQKDYEGLVKKLGPNKPTKFNRLVSQINSIKACVDDLNNGGNFKFKDGFLSTVSAKIKMVGQ